jgi:hypothetical protein
MPPQADFYYDFYYIPTTSKRNKKEERQAYINNKGSSLPIGQKIRKCPMGRPDNM